MHPATWERMMQDEEYERALQTDIEREEREAEMARQAANMAPCQVEGAEEGDEEEEEGTCITLEELRARRLRFFEPPTSSKRTARCGASTKAGTPCRRFAAVGCNGLCVAHKTQ